jgi:hypothetical protein
METKYIHIVFAFETPLLCILKLKEDLKGLVQLILINIWSLQIIMFPSDIIYKAKWTMCIDFDNRWSSDVYTTST